MLATVGDRRVGILGEMLLRTVRRKLVALAAISTVAMVAVIPILSWMLQRRLDNEVDEHVPAAIRGFEQELDDEVRDLDVTAQVIGDHEDGAIALAARDTDGLAHLMSAFHAAYPRLEIVFYDRSGDLVFALGGNSARARLALGLGRMHQTLDDPCRADSRGTPAIAVARAVGAAGTGVVCVPLDARLLDAAVRKLGAQFAIVRSGAVLSTSAAFPRDAVDGTRTSEIDVAGGWARAAFTPLVADLGGGEDRLRFVAAVDVRPFEAIVRRNLLLMLAALALASVIALLAGVRLASRMSRALSRVTGAFRQLERHDYVRVEPVVTGDELEDLANGFNSMVDGLRERDKLRATMGKYMTEQVVAHVLAGEVELGGDTLEVTILFCDLRGFTNLSEKRTAQEVVQLLNEYFTEMVDAIMEEGGVVDKYIGDAVMAVFGAPVSAPDDALRAVRAAVRMREALARINERAAVRGEPPLQFGIGIHSGEVVAGNIGSARRMEYTVIGDAVNLASRLESSTKQLGTDILISEATYARTEGHVDASRVDAIAVRGREARVAIYTVAGVRAG